MITSISCGNLPRVKYRGMPSDSVPVLMDFAAQSNMTIAMIAAASKLVMCSVTQEITGLSMTCSTGLAEASSSIIGSSGFRFAGSRCRGHLLEAIGGDSSFCKQHDCKGQKHADEQRSHRQLSREV